MDTSGDGKVSEAEFLAFVLIECGKCDREFLEGVQDTFKELDQDGSGELCLEVRGLSQLTTTFCS
jgi:Ca2+-binding EF-hand superfamily protein